MGCSEREDYGDWRREDGSTILIGVMVQPLWHLAWMIWGNKFGQKWYGDWDKVRISIRTLNRTWSYEQSHWPEHFISIWSRKGKTLSCGWHKMTSDNKREGWRKDANAQNAKIPPPNLPCLAPCPVKLPSDVPSLGSARLSDRYIIEPRRGVWTDCLLLPLLFLMGSSEPQNHLCFTSPRYFPLSTPSLPQESSLAPPFSASIFTWHFSSRSVFFFFLDIFECFFNGRMYCNIKHIHLKTLRNLYFVPSSPNLG